MFLIVLGISFIFLPFLLTYVLCLGQETGSGCGDIILIFAPLLPIGVIMAIVGTIIKSGGGIISRKVVETPNTTSSFPKNSSILEKAFIPLSVLVALLYFFSFFSFEEKGYGYLRYLPILLIGSIFPVYYPQKVSRGVFFMSTLVPIFIFVIELLFILY